MVRSAGLRPIRTPTTPVAPSAPPTKRPPTPSPTTAAFASGRPAPTSTATEASSPEIQHERPPRLHRPPRRRPAHGTDPPTVGPLAARERHQPRPGVLRGPHPRPAGALPLRRGGGAVAGTGHHLPPDV